jgi:hypothetical protein
LLVALSNTRDRNASVSPWRVRRIRRSRSVTPAFQVFGQ